MTGGFTIQNIELRNFRNYKSHTQKFDAGVNKIIGPNATGKTNLIEAIGLMTQVASFKHATTAELTNICSENQPCQIKAEIYDSNLDQTFEFILDIVDGKKTYTLNGKKKSISELKGRFPSVIFNPDDLALCKGSNTMRRDAVDALGSQISKDYFTVMHDYDRALKQKNAMLTSDASEDMIKSVNEVMLAPGAQLTFYRLALVKKMSPVIAKFYSEIAGCDETLGIEYYPS